LRNILTFTLVLSSVGFFLGDQNHLLASPYGQTPSQPFSLEALFPQAHAIASLSDSPGFLLKHLGRTYARICDEPGAQKTYEEITSLPPIILRNSTLPASFERKVSNLKDYLFIAKGFQGRPCNHTAKLWLDRASAKAWGIPKNTPEFSAVLWDILEGYIDVREWAKVESLFQALLSLSSQPQEPTWANAPNRWSVYLQRIEREVRLGAKEQARATINRLLDQLRHPHLPVSPATFFTLVATFQIPVDDPSGALYSLQEAVGSRQRYVDGLKQQGDFEEVVMVERDYMFRNVMDWGMLALHQAEKGDRNGTAQTLHWVIEEIPTIGLSRRTHVWRQVYEAASVSGNLALARKAFQQDMEGPEYHGQKFLAALVQAGKTTEALQLTKDPKDLGMIACLQTKNGDLEGALASLTLVPEKDSNGLFGPDLKVIAQGMVQSRGLSQGQTWASQWASHPTQQIYVILGIIEGLENSESLLKKPNQECSNKWDI